MRGISSAKAGVLLPLAIFSFLAATAAHGESLLVTVPKVPNDVALRDRDSLYCESWKFSVENNDAGIWETIPARCLKYVEEYMLGPRYAADCAVVAERSIEYARSLSISPNSGKDAWIFDVDETLLSNLPYYTVNEYGAQPFNETSFDEWVDSAEAPAIDASLRLYRELQRLGFTLIILTGRSEHQRQSTANNLRKVGYGGWKEFFLRQAADQGTTAESYKSQVRAWLVAEGYKIHGNSGDQWSDLAGAPMATRSFKLPNPLYSLA